MKKFYAVLMDEEDNDWSYGSYDLEEAVKMAEKFEDGRIAVIEQGADPVCVDIITKEQF